MFGGQLPIWRTVCAASVVRGMIANSASVTCFGRWSAGRMDMGTAADRPIVGSDVGQRRKHGGRAAAFLYPPTEAVEERRVLRWPVPASTRRSPEAVLSELAEIAAARHPTRGRREPLQRADASPDSSAKSTISSLTACCWSVQKSEYATSCASR